MSGKPKRHYSELPLTFGITRLKMLGGLIVAIVLFIFLFVYPYISGEDFSPERIRQTFGFLWLWPVLTYYYFLFSRNFVAKTTGYNILRFPLAINRVRFAPGQVGLPYKEPDTRVFATYKFKTSSMYRFTSEKWLSRNTRKAYVVSEKMRFISFSFFVLFVIGYLSIFWLCIFIGGL